MRIYRSLDEVPPGFGPSALTIGNFDGMHAGHRRILRRVRQAASEHGWKPSLLTFEPHPTRVVAPARTPRLMTTPEQRCALAAEEGIQQALILPFTPEIARLEPEEFVSRILAEKLGARAVLVGDNFRFGHGQHGNTDVLRRLGEQYGLLTEIVSAVRLRGQTVSSSAIRRWVEAGQVARAGRLLERCYALEGEVVPGHGIGSRRTVPTLNLAPTAEVWPGRGVYITRTHDLDAPRSWNSVTNIGVRPTFGGDDRPSIETFLLDSLDGGAPRRIRVEFLHRLRDERKFDSPEALKQQIFRDVARARIYFRRLARSGAIALG